MTSKLSRRSFLKHALSGFAQLAVLSAGGYGYARYAEPRWLQTKHLTLTLKRLPPAFNGMRIVQFSDVHLGFHYTAEQLSHLVGIIQSHEPDLICFTGDLYDYVVLEDAPAVIQALSRLEAPLGKGAVLGNHDYYGKEPKKITKILADSGFYVLNNQSVALNRGKDYIWLSGIEDMWNGQPDIDKTMQSVPPNDFVLLLSHCPDFADIALQYPIDLQLSGHSHGGQVRLPFYGHIVTPEYAKKYVDGLYILGDGKLQVYTNRGIGVSQYPVRFYCRPELTVLTLQSG